MMKTFIMRTIEAESLLHDRDKMDDFLTRVESRFKEIKGVGKGLAKIPLLVKLVRSYIKREYVDIPVGAIIAAVGALIYFVTPIDLIPDAIPGLGKVDDIAVLGIALKLIGADLEDYEQWRIRQGKQ